MFPITGSNSDQQYIFPLVDYTCRDSVIVGRGTCIASVLVAIRDIPIRANILKMSWQYSTRKTEAGNISHRRGILAEHSKKFLPRTAFSERYTATQVDLPRLRIYNTECNTWMTTDDDRRARDVDRALHIILNPAYISIRKARNVEEFKRAFLDCLESKQYFYFHITLPQLTFGVQVITIATPPEWCSTAISATTISCYTDQAKPIEPITKSARNFLACKGYWCSNITCL